MRYWLYDEERLDGPFRAEELAGRPDFGRDTLVLPEDRLDESERWLPADKVPQLSLLLDERSRAEFARSLRPPEPTARDLQVLGSILETSERLQGVVVGMRAELAGHDDRLADLARVDAEAAERAAALKQALGALEGRVASLEALREDFARLSAAFAASEADRAALHRRLEALVKELESESSRAKALAEEMPARWRAFADETATLRSALAAEADARRALEADLSARLAKAEAARQALAEDLSRRRAADAAAEAERWRLWRWRLTPRGVFGTAVFAILLALAALALLYKGRRAPAPPPPATTPAEEPPPGPGPLYGPEWVPPPPRPRKARPRPETKEEKEKRLRHSILLRATGGVPSSRKGTEKDMEKLSDSSPQP